MGAGRFIDNQVGSDSAKIVGRLSLYIGFASLCKSSIITRSQALAVKHCSFEVQNLTDGICHIVNGKRFQEETLNAH